MRVKSPEKKPFFLKALFNKVFISNQSTRFKVIGILFVLILIGAAGIGFLAKKEILEKIGRNLTYMVQGVFLEPPEHITIDMKFKHYQRLSELRKEALETGVLKRDEYVPAEITYKDKKVKVRIRLKGDLIEDHWEGDQWSFRVKTKREDTLFGMKRFSLHRPAARHYLSEWVFHKMLHREGLVALRYKFIDVTLNGKKLGLYALEEHFGKRLIENSGGREGIIFLFDDFFISSKQAHQKNSTIETVSAHPKGTDKEYFNVELRAHEMGKILKTPVLFDQFKVGKELIERYRRGELKLSQIYDVQKFATYFAIRDLTGAWHHLLFPNVRMYYNPVTSLLEPIGFNASNALTPVEHLSPDIYKMYDNMFFGRMINFWEEEEIAKSYLQELERISHESYVDQLVNDIEEHMKRNVALLWNLGIKEGIKAQSFEYVDRILHQNALSIRKKITPIKGCYVYFSRVVDQKLFLKIGNTETIPMAIEKITYEDHTIFEADESIILPPKEFRAPMRYQEYSFDLPDYLDWEDGMIHDVQVHYSVLGTSHKMQESVHPWDFLDDNFFAQDFIRKEPNFENVEFLAVDPKAMIIFVQPGIWNVREDIIIPSGWEVFANGGVVLNLMDNAKILSYSSFQWVATEDDPIKIISMDKTGQGIVLMKGNNPSHFKHVIFEDLTNPHQGGWALTGAVTFYETEVNISYCRFLNSRAEDSLNIIRSQFLIEKSLFSNSAFDAVDSDFSKGEIKKTSFWNTGNDALDFSGSVVAVIKTRIHKTKDKGVSIGEASTVHMRDLEIKEASIGVATKDSSVANIDSIDIAQSQRAFAAYQKKSEYGPASVSVNNLKLDDVLSPYLIEQTSTLVVEGKKVTSDQEQVKDFLANL